VNAEEKSLNATNIPFIEKIEPCGVKPTDGRCGQTAELRTPRYFSGDTVLEKLEGKVKVLIFCYFVFKPQAVIAKISYFWKNLWS